MNYRHAFHAGNFADVVKHVALALCVDRLNAKPTPWRFIDTHAGVGLYDLQSEAAQRSPEWRDGVARVWEAEGAAPEAVRAALAPWFKVLHLINPEGRLETYPGSPVLVQEMAREADALRLCELHPESYDLLHQAMGRDRRVKIEMRDGYDALPAYLPPPERRGVVLIDPPFEAGTQGRKADFQMMLKAARAAIKRWPQGVFLFWRPLKDIDAVEAFDADLATDLVERGGVDPGKLLVADLWVRDLGQEGPLAGAGLVIVNAPFGVAEQLEIALPWLAQVLDQSPDGRRSGAGFRLVRPAPDA